MEEHTETTWLSVIGKAAAYLCLNGTALKDKTLAQRAAFLSALGLSNKDIASMLDSTPASIAELIRQTRSKKSGNRGNGKKTRADKRK